MPQAKARKERRKLPFLKAFVRVGTITGAAKASRISRDAVHDWLRNDPSFRREFSHARALHDDADFQSLDGALSLLLQTVRRAVPAEFWPRVMAELNLALVNLKNDLKEGGRRQWAVPSGNVAEVSLSPEMLADVAILGRDSDPSADNL